jgi:hypothetical protein
MKPIRPVTKTSSSSAPRSAQVRERRTVTSQARVHAAVRQAANPVVRRSVPVSPGSNAQPVMNRAKSKARRKFSIALSSDGARIVLPSLPMVRPGWQTLSAVLVVALLAAIIFVSSSDTFRIDSLTVNGAQRLQPADLMAVMDVNGEPVFALNPDEMTRKLQKAYPELSSIQISVGLPNQVALDVVERQPVFEWKYGDTTLWIDMEGAAFLPRGAATLAVTVVADVPPTFVFVENAPENSAAVFSAIARLLGSPLMVYDPTLQRVDNDMLMSAASLTLRKPAESPLVYLEAEGFGWRDPRGWDVYFGQDLNDLDLKWEMYQAIINQLAQQGIQPTMISVSHVHAPFYRAPQGVDTEQ